MKKIQDTLSKVDIIGYDIKFTHNNQPKFKTAFGGCMTALGAIGLIGYFAALVQQIANYENSKLITFDKYREAIHNVEKYILTRENFDFAMLITTQAPMMNSTDVID
jgi:hypothetical protein